ncbi:glycosyltransferase family 25 protein [Spongiibacter taiwanensis]|uniref:glycosyltransferase family 25 protein n=1 Tax=Spongiibacter taiwanensis TaxID=1748242 RepID=UPI0020351B4C|nr:glycosyltransferase family 25 protein [Spongiibacter taiwanensis]USA44257.1 glycosyltransferase family 25 protein [Spongiibacter taiwanensis]
MVSNEVECYVINLERDRQKKSYMEELLSNLGVSAVFFHAIDGSLIKPSQKVDLYSSIGSRAKIGRVLTSAEIGCALSHIEVYKKIILQDKKYALILEDDVIIEPDFKSVCAAAVERIENSDIIFLGSHTSSNRHKDVFLKIRGKTQISLGRYIGYPAEPPYGAYAYLVSRASAKKMLEIVANLSLPIDHYTSSSALLDIKVIKPSVIRVNSKLETLSNLNEDRYRLHQAKLRISKKNRLRKNIIIGLGVYPIYKAFSKKIRIFFNILNPT